MESRQSRRRNRRTEDRKEYRSPLGPYLRTILVAVVIALLLRTLVVFAVAVEGPSMEPTLHTSDVVMVEKVSLYFGAPNRMDIVIVEYPNRSGLFVKRVIGLPGETLEVREGRVYMDGTPLDDPYNPDGTMARDMEPVTVPPGTVFVMGDNRNHSMDSRDETVGPIPLEKVRGKGLVLIWPLNKLKILE